MLLAQADQIEVVEPDEMKRFAEKYLLTIKNRNMIKAIINNKDRLDNGGSIKQNEDARTAMTFSRLLYLPEELLWTFMTKACTTLPKLTGKLLSVEFWPKWSPAETNNSVYVEPDIFMRFDDFDLIIEAKKNDNNLENGQTEEQWKNEIQSYRNEYKDDQKKLFLLAIGGNNDLSSCEKIISGKAYTIHKCSWLKLLHAITDYKEQSSSLVGYTNYHDAMLRIINDIIDIFNLYGDHSINYLYKLNSFNYSISDTSLKDIKLWTIAK